MRSKKSSKVKTTIILVAILCLFISSCYASSFYKNLKEELIYSLENEYGNSTQGYSIAKYDDAVDGAIVGFDMVTNRIFIIGEISSNKYELCSWDCRGRDFNNVYEMFDIICTQGIVDNLCIDTPITYLYRYTEELGWNTVYLGSADSAFELQAKLHGWE